jgi:hypothetical protein
MKTYSTNRKLYLLVGLSLAGMIFVLSRTGQAEKDAQYATAVSGKMVGKNSSAVLAKMETLAKSDHIALLEFCQSHYRDTYHDYTCLLQKQERMGGILGQVQEVDVKFMGEPFSVSMHWIKNHPSIADRVLYVEGKWNDQMIVRPSGLLSFLGPQFRPPGGADALKSSLKPITAFGIERTTRSLIDVYTLAQKNGDLRQEFGGYAKVDGRNALVLVRYLPCKPEYPGWKTLTYIDLEYIEPIMLETYGWDDEHLLSCRYVFRNTKFNVGLTKEDFLPQANEMIEPR